MPLEILKSSNNKETLKVNTITNACENTKYFWTNTCRVDDSTLDHSAIDYTNDIYNIPRSILPNSINNNIREIRFNQLFPCVIGHSYTTNEYDFKHTLEFTP